MSEFKFDNGKSDAVNLAGLLENIFNGFTKTVSVVAASKNSPAPHNIKIGMVISLGMANGIGILFGMNRETIINGYKQYLRNFEKDDVDGMLNFIGELSNDSRYSPWIERGGMAVRAFMEDEQAEASMMQLATNYFDARD